MKWLKENRLKIVSVMAVTADLLMGLAGGVSLFFWDRPNHLPDIFLMTACALAMTGHGGLLVWGKGGNTHKMASSVCPRSEKLWLGTLRPWRYPLDWAFLNFVMAGALYAAAGLASANIPLFMKGSLVALASMTGWLWPQDKLLFGAYSMKVTALLYVTASISTFFAGLVAHNGFIVAAACVYICINAILYTVRKENQSAYTQGGL